MSIVKFTIQLDIPSKYIEDFYVIISVIVVGIFSERLTGTSCQDFSLWYFDTSLAVVKTDDAKNIVLKNIITTQ